MKIQRQFILSIMIFTAVLIVITASIVNTNLQLSTIDHRQNVSGGIESRLDVLNRLSTEFFLYQQPEQLASWQSNMTATINDLSSLASADSYQQTLLNDARNDLNDLNVTFYKLVSFLVSAPRNQSVRILPEFQNTWDQLASQHQATAIDASNFSQSLRNQAEQEETISLVLIVALVGVFGAFLLTNYFVFYRRTLKSISDLQSGIRTVGSGNLDYVIKTEGDDEISDLTGSFNQMTTNLKKVTASKAALEKEVSERERTEAALEASRAALQTEKNILQTVMDEPKNVHLVYLDNNFNFVRVNSAYAKTCGYKPEEMIGKNHFALYPHEENERIFAQVRDTGEPISFHDKPFTFPDQPERGVTYWDWTLSPIKDQSGKVEGLVFALVETTERKRAEQDLLTALDESNQRQAEVSALLKASRAVLQNREFKSSARMIFDSCKQLMGATSGYVALLSGDGKDNIVLFLDSGGMPCTVDPSLPMPIRGLRALTYHSGKVSVENNFLQSEWVKLMPRGHLDLKNVLFSPLTVEGKTVGILGLANKSGGFSERDAQLALAFGEIASIALINSNMMEMIEESSKKLKAYSENLELLVDEKTKQLKDAERLAAIGATAGMVGHDIRNPLQAIVSDLYLIKSDLTAVPECTEKGGIQESVASIDKNIEYVNKIVQDLQDFAKPVKVTVRETHLKDVLEETIKGVRFPDEIKVVSRLNGELKLEADPDVLKRIFSNLILNAIQAMPDGGKLTVGARQEADSIQVFVQDNGVGVPKEVKEKLFTPLFTTKSKGQGFGLAVVKRLTEASGGTVTFESQEGKGTKFIVTLPTKKQAATSSA